MCCCWVGCELKASTDKVDNGPLITEILQLRAGLIPTHSSDVFGTQFLPAVMGEVDGKCAVVWVAWICFWQGKKASAMLGFENYAAESLASKRLS